MNQNNHPGGPQIIKIDGTKVKQLREQQGLTQLYVATVVEVTTDTISRWENKRYPTIKKENGLKLAQALEVDLHDILDDEVEENSENTKQPEEIESHTENFVVEEPLTTKPGSDIDPAIKQHISTAAPEISILSIKSIFSFAAIAILISSLYFFYSYFQRTREPANATSLQAVRSLPAHFIPGQPFPVAVNILSESDITLSFVVKEQIPIAFTVQHTSPATDLSKLKNNTIKWLKKSTEQNRLLYTLTTPKDLDHEVTFHGTISSSHMEEQLNIEGNNKILPSIYHWADTDMNNRISDKEILFAYDNFEDAQEIDFNMLEEIWIGSGYKWDEEQEKIIIVP